MRALILTANGFEESELTVPREKLAAQGAQFDIAAPVAGPIRGKHGLPAVADARFADIDPERYDLLILPGGKAPAVVLQDGTALALVRAFFRSRKPVAAICHGLQILVAAGVMKDRRATCHHSIARELTNAGAHYVDREVVVDGNLITSRGPADLPAFVKEISKLLEAPDR